LLSALTLQCFPPLLVTDSEETPFGIVVLEAF
jgi:hypothetical protein